jgi:hypothetical protein
MGDHDLGFFDSGQVNTGKRNEVGVNVRTAKKEGSLQGFN